ncbi:MAG: alkaline phosphatase family protein [Acidobacteriia bacterium]|nr:alkaline phosphatase family protein [Terriglobia bacterium]
MALPPRPKLFVLVILDQFRPDYLDSTGFPLAPGGFRRLLEKGAYFPDCRHLASTFQASSIATLATGAWPAQHGIVADSWYDRSIRKPVPANDEDLLATTLAAQVAADQRAKVAVVSLDAEHGSLFAGTPDARQFWMDDAGEFATLGEPPDWLAGYNTQKPVASFHDMKWTALNARPDAPPLRTLTYSPDRPREFMALYRSSYYAQDALFDFAAELLTRDKLGQGSSLDLLCILAGSTGLLGYEIGGRHPLMQQMTLRLDQKIESLLNQLTKSPGEKGFNLVLAAAHGAPPEPTPDVRDRMAVKGEALAQAVERSLSASGIGHVEKYLYPFLYLDTSGFRDPEPIREVAARAALGFPAVANYYTAGGACSTGDAWERRFRNSFHPTRSGDVMLSYQPEYVEESGQARGISYGSLYNYDVRVPLCFYGPQFRPGVFERPVESVDIAPTLARAMGVAAPSSSIGRVLGEAFAP